MNSVEVEKQMIQEHFYVKHNRALIKLSVNEISFVKVDGRYSELYHIEDRFICRKSLKEIQGLLPKEIFVRSHRNYLINKNYVKTVVFDENSIYLTNGKILPVSTRYLNEVRGMFPIVG